MSTHSRVPTYTVRLGLTGRKAIAAVERDLAGDGVSLTLHKFADELGEAEDDIDLARAEEIHKIDPGLVHLCGEISFYEFNGGTWAACGKLQVCLRDDIRHCFITADQRCATSKHTIAEIAAMYGERTIRVLAATVLGNDLTTLADIAHKAIAATLRDALEDA